MSQNGGEPVGFWIVELAFGLLHGAETTSLFASPL
jgi:hypothetical protein